MILPESSQWQKTGCFCVRFFRDGQEEYVIIDDFFPSMKVDGKFEWAYVKGGATGEELWPMVLEKAYAKLYGSFSFIEAGKIQYALADMVQGFPEQIDLKNDAKNQDAFWEKLLLLQKQGALLGAGSPENAQGDSAINTLGIVQGHAYAVLDMQEIDNSKLIKLRNPHGKSGAEWNGDWCDTSPNWNQRSKTKLKYEPKDHEDGIFWMDIFDFTEQYSFLYICRILTESTGWKKVEHSGEWKGDTAEGLPSRAYPSARLELNPQYSITITKPSDGFILLKQKDADPVSNSTYKGKNSIFFMVSKNNGKRINKVDKDLIVTRSGNPTNLAIVTSECIFDKQVSYPYTFSLLLATATHGGEGSFDVIVYSNDMAMEVKAL